MAETGDIMNGEVLKRAAKAQEALNEFGELMADCTDLDEEKEAEFIEYLQILIQLGRLALTREQVLVCLSGSVLNELESLIGHLTVTQIGESK